MFSPFRFVRVAVVLLPPSPPPPPHVSHLVQLPCEARYSKLHILLLTLYEYESASDGECEVSRLMYV